MLPFTTLLTNAHHFHAWPWVPIIPIIIFIIIWVIVITNVIRFRRRMQEMGGWQHRHHWQASSVEPTAIEILNNRFAKGEIDEIEFMKRKRYLLMTEQELRDKVDESSAQASEIED